MDYTKGAFSATLRDVGLGGEEDMRRLGRKEGGAGGGKDFVCVRAVDDSGNLGYGVNRKLNLMVCNYTLLYRKRRKGRKWAGEKSDDDIPHSANAERLL